MCFPFALKVTHHVTEKRSRSLSRSLSDKFIEQQPRPAGFAFLADIEKKKSRGREKSRDRLDVRIRDKTRDKSRDNILRSRSKEKLLDHSPNKLNTKGQDQRKLSKQNTYIFQNGRSTRVQEKKQEADAVRRLNRSIENLDYSRVADDISPVHEEEEDEEGEEHYTEICEYILNKNSSHRHLKNERPGRQRSFGDKENGNRQRTKGSDDVENNLSFTLLKKDIGGYYVKIPGFEVPRDDQDHGISPDPISKGSDSLC